MKENAIYRQIIDTPIGQVISLCSQDNLLLLEYADRPSLPLEVELVSKSKNGEILDKENRIGNQTANELTEYFEGRLKEFTIPVELIGTPFQIKVWQQLYSIAYGHTSSYKEQSELFGNTKAIRAIASANGNNHLAIIVPCHRVIGSDGKLIGYSGGLWRKKYLLQLEINHAIAPKAGNLF